MKAILFWFHFTFDFDFNKQSNRQSVITEYMKIYPEAELLIDDWCVKCQYHLWKHFIFSSSPASSTQFVQLQFEYQKQNTMYNTQLKFKHISHYFLNKLSLKMTSTEQHLLVLTLVELSLLAQCRVVSTNTSALISSVSLRGNIVP